uniref:Cytosolic Fe-S cluster assembly factor NUBP1 homolog n=1 Tax=Mesocestoides corti TaxID=53468 RepID=A0A5K3EZF3_MESCO
MSAPLFGTTNVHASGDLPPDNAPANCPGPKSATAGSASSCAGCPNQALCASGVANLPLEQREPEVVAELRRRLGRVKRCLFVLSGKGGVGKSSVSVCLARALSQRNNCSEQVGLLDLDLCGPSVPCFMGCLDAEVHQSATGWSPVFVTDNLALMSLGFLTTPDQAIIWRGPRKNAFIRDLLLKVAWTDDDPDAPPLDYLIIDTPPGTSDEHLSAVPYVRAAGCPTAALIVTTPQELALSDVRKEINFCQKIGLPILGVVENMSSFDCPKCGVSSNLFPKTTGGADSLQGSEVIGRIPFDPRLTRCLDEGRCPFEEAASNQPDNSCIHSGLPVINAFESLISSIDEKFLQLKS